ncbi:MAG: MBL fold metallo-hydrolase [Betaproteobacteria bacterium HGW-Betaproteobacteria-12]|jgi:quinoprotein relay system zinc metallohydrolase 1|nr:MAG: MBL fold metallo-hydrolase [Betaproteobacteria bacterium HGW-Betaproteobacteria-12]
MKRCLASLLMLVAGLAGAAEFDYGLQAQRVAGDVHAFIGKTEDFTTANGGNIVNTGFIVAPGGVIVIDSGPSLRYGEQMRRAIAAVSDRPPLLLINTHHHPDHFLGNQAFVGVPLAALPATIQGIAGEGNAFAENLFRLTGDWMKGTEVRVPERALAAGTTEIAGRRLRLIALDGHTGADLAIYDEASGVLFAGDLAFFQRAPTTPHADVGRWLAALDKLEAITREPGFTAIVPGHGPVSRDAAPLRQTRAWLVWLQGALQRAAGDGLDMNEVLARPLPDEFAALPVAASEYRRSVGHLFPAVEQHALGAGH